MRYGSYALFALSLLSLLIALLTNCMYLLIVPAVTVFSWILAPAFLILKWMNKKPMLTHLRFEDTAILNCLGKLVLKRIPYEKVLGATIQYAMNPYKYPYLDPENKERAVLTLYQSDVSFLFDIKSNSGIGWYGGGLNALCYDLSYEKHLRILLDKTPIKVYITEQMLTLHYDLLSDILQAYPDRFFVAYLDKLVQEEKRAPYAEYLRYKKEST